MIFSFHLCLFIKFIASVYLLDCMLMRQFYARHKFDVKADIPPGEAKNTIFQMQVSSIPFKLTAHSFCQKTLYAR